MNESFSVRQRVAVVRTLDHLFHEPGAQRRSHKACYRLLAGPLLGISYATFRNYLHARPEELGAYRPAPHIETGLRAMVRELLGESK